MTTGRTTGAGAAPTGCTTALLHRLAGEHGATLRDQSPALELRDLGSRGVEVETAATRYYGLPSYGEQKVKVAQDCGGPVVSGDARGFDPRLRARRRAVGHPVSWLV